MSEHHPDKLTGLPFIDDSQIKDLGILYLLKALLNYSSKEHPLKLWGAGVEPIDGTLGAYMKKHYSDTFGRSTLYRKLRGLEDFLNNPLPEDDSKGFLNMRIEYARGMIYLTRSISTKDLAVLNVLIDGSNLSYAEKEHLLNAIRVLAHGKYSDYGEEISEFKRKLAGDENDRGDLTSDDLSAIEYLNVAIKRRCGLLIETSHVLLNDSFDLHNGRSLFYPFFYVQNKGNIFIVGTTAAETPPLGEKDFMIKILAVDTKDICKMWLQSCRTEEDKKIYSKSAKAIKAFPLDRYLKAHPVLSSGYWNKPKREEIAYVDIYERGNKCLLMEVETYANAKFEFVDCDRSSNVIKAKIRASKETITKTALCYPGIFIVRKPANLVKYIKERIEFSSKAYAEKGKFDCKSFSEEFKERFSEIFPDDREELD